MASINHKTLTTEIEISAYLHRQRMAILEAMGGAAATASQIAAKMGVHPANLTRHIRTLVKAGLVELVEKRDTGRNLEKYYRAVATSFDVALGANELKASHKVALAFARSDISAALAQLPDQEIRPVAAYVGAARLREADIQRFQKALSELVKTFLAADTSDGEPYHINLSLYPGEVQPRETRKITLEKGSKS